MCLFTACLVKIIPLYLNIILGYIAGKVLDVSRDSIARLMFYLINPLIVFNGVIHTNLNYSILLLPVITFFISVFLCLTFYKLSINLLSETTRNLLSFSAGTGNTGFFGLPMALLLFDTQGEGVYIMGLLGITFYENTVGYYILARDKESPGSCFLKLFKLPILYALIGGLIINVIQMPISEIFFEFMQQIKGAYMVLGMMIIGIGLAGLTQFKIDYKFVGLSFVAKFIAWPIAVLLLIGVGYLFGYYNKDIYNALILLSIVPLAVNTVLMASILKSEPEKAATAVVASIVFALFYVPIMANYLIVSPLI